LDNELSVVAVGDLIEDVIVVTDPDPEIDTDNSAKIYGRVGGGAANFAVWAASLSMDSKLMARVGKGDAAKYSRYLAKLGVKAELQEDKELETGRIVVISDGTNRTFYTDRGANINLETHLMSTDMFSSAMFISGYTILSLGTENTQALIKFAHENGMVVFLDPASHSFIEDYGVDYFAAAIEGCDVLLPNEAEAHILTGESDPMKAADILQKRYGAVAITLGAEGAVVANGEGVSKVPAPKVKATDTTGAGDAFNAMLVRKLLEEERLVDAAREACAFASEAVSMVGAHPTKKIEL
jgi:sugar/nucleoside kinase (ribokinase family)